MAFDLGDYVDVASRIREFAAKYPDGSLRAADLQHPYRIEVIGAQTFIVYVAAAYRTPDDPAPGIGSAWEPVPGQSPYTKNSELQNAETSAWGRAILAVFASASKSITSQEEVRNRQADVAPVEPLGDGWATYAERDDVWDELRKATLALDDEAKAEVQAAVKAMGFNKATFSVGDSVKWEALIPAEGAT